MPSSTAAGWPNPGRFALALGACLTLTLTAAWLWGPTLIEILLPAARLALGWIDNRFGILSLGIERNWQDTVVHLRLNISAGFVMGGRVIIPDPRGFLTVDTPIGNLLQPLAIAPAIAAALPGKFVQRLIQFGLATLFALGFLVIDLPLALHAIAWDMLTYSLGMDDFSPLLAWLAFLNGGGRLGIALLLGVAGWKSSQNFLNAMRALATQAEPESQ